MSTYEILLNKMKHTMHHLKESGYDVDKYMESLSLQTGQLEYFYCHIAKNKEANHVYYHIEKRPLEHQVAYFNIGRGYPKELMDGHYCYIVKDLGLKMLIIPTTSIKKDSVKVNHNFEKDILILLQGKKVYSRLQLSDMRMVDIQRLDTRKEYCKVYTKRKEIEGFIQKRIFKY